jgi:hypothetical protein
VRVFCSICMMFLIPFIFKRYLYVLIVALDACFRLKRRIVSSEKKDPGLGTGWGYFVEDEPYRKYLLTVTDQEEVRVFAGPYIFV